MLWSGVEGHRLDSIAHHRYIHERNHTRMLCCVYLIEGEWLWCGSHTTTNVRRWHSVKNSTLSQTGNTTVDCSHLCTYVSAQVALLMYIRTKCLFQTARIIIDLYWETDHEIRKLSDNLIHHFASIDTLQYSLVQLDVSQPHIHHNHHSGDHPTLDRDQTYICLLYTSPSPRDS